MLMRAELPTAESCWSGARLCVIVHFDISFATAIPTQIKTEGGTDTDHNNRDFVKTPIPGLVL
jgi:hypothetical protein